MIVPTGAAYREFFNRSKAGGATDWEMRRPKESGVALRMQVAHTCLHCGLRREFHAGARGTKCSLEPTDYERFGLKRATALYVKAMRELERVS